MEAMEYEYLVRRVFHTARTTANGAEADIYRKMERAQRDLKTQSMFRTQEDREYEFQQSFATVRFHVVNAMKEGLMQIRSRADNEIIANLESMQNQLTYDFYDKAALDEIVRNAGAYFHEFGLVMI